MELAEEVEHAGPGQPVNKICFDCLEGKSADEDRVPERLVCLYQEKAYFSIPGQSANDLI